MVIVNIGPINSNILIFFSGTKKPADKYLKSKNR